MPQLGETVAEGKITKWFKAAGDAVKPGDNLFEIETDKTSMEVPATFGGTLTEIRFSVGEVAKVGAVVAVISGARSPRRSRRRRHAAPIPPIRAPVTRRRSRQPARQAASRQRDDADAAAIRTDGSLFTKCARRSVITARPRLAGGSFTHAAGAPARRRSAASICRASSGSGPHGRIVAAMSSGRRPVRQRAAMATGASAAQVKALYEGVAFEEIAARRHASTIATRLVEAKQTIPHFYLTADLDVGRLIAMREEANAAAPKSKTASRLQAVAQRFHHQGLGGGVAARSRRQRRVGRRPHPALPHSDIGIAVALEGGLITPVIRNAESQVAHRDLGRDARSRRARARTRNSRPHEYQGGSSAISNLGMYGVREFSAIINPPQATILAVGATRRAPVEAEDGERQVRQPDDRHVVLRSSRRRRRARRRAAGGIQEFCRKAGHGVGLSME